MINRAFLVFLLLSIPSVAQTQSAAFDGVEKWKGALAASDMTLLKSSYSTDPPAKALDKDKKPTADIASETDFWQKVISSGPSGLEVSIVGEQDQQALHVVSLQVSMKIKTPSGPRTRYVTEQQAWQRQGDNWRIVVASHSDLFKMRPARKPNPNLYNKDADARTEIKEALTAAAKEHQRVILVFGGNWCYDCHVLDQEFHQDDVVAILEKNFRSYMWISATTGRRTTIWRQNIKRPSTRVCPCWLFSAPTARYFTRSRMANGSRRGRSIPTM